MEQFLAEVTPYFIDFLAVCIGCLFAYLGTKAKTLYTETVNTQVKKDVVNSTVQYIEQIYKDIHGEEKLNKALEKAEELLTEKGIPVNKEELTVLIEAAVNSFNGGFVKGE